VAGDAWALVAKCDGFYGSDWSDLISDISSGAPSG
jgi:hypothetical protein